MSEPFACEAEPSDFTGTLAPSLLDELAELCCFALENEGLTGAWSVTLAFISDAHMAELHQSFMNLPDTTDILTFPSGDEPGGDIAISVPQADRQRVEGGWDLTGELRFLVVHGALHLAGWDDSTPEQRTGMLRRQRETIEAFQDASDRSR